MESSNVTGLLELAESISRSAMQITKYHLNAHGAVPSFDVPSSQATGHGEGHPKEPPAIIAARSELIVAASQITALTQGPGGFLRSLSYSYHEMTALSVVLAFNIQEHVPTQGDISFISLSEKAGFDQHRLERILRLLFVSNIFRESRPSHVAHSVTSLELKNNKEMTAFLGHCAFEAFPAASRLSDSIAQYPYSQDPHETGFNIALNTSDPLFTYLSKNPARFDRFNLGMAGISQAIGRSSQQVIEGYPWRDLGSAIVIDVGGGNGHISIALARSFPKLNMVVQDLPQAIVGAEEQVPKDLKERVVFQGHDMFDPQPESEARVYYLRHVLHDWPDHYAVKILKNIIPRMKANSILLISDSVIPGPGQMGVLDEKFVRYLDLQMMVLHNARERTEKNWTEIFRSTDPRLRLEKVWVKGESMAASTIIEGRLAPETNGHTNETTNGIH